MRARARISRLAAVGAAIGLALATMTAVAPASAAKSQPASSQATTTSYTCGYFNGRTVTANTVSVSPVSLKAAEVIGVTVSPARVGDTIILSVGTGMTINFYEAPATSGLQFKAPNDGTYGLGWSLEASGTRPSSITWTFTCSTGSGSTGTTTTDADRDGVANSADACAGTTLPDAIKRKVTGRYYALSSGRFVDGAGTSAGITVIDAGGCSALQIASKLGLGKTDTRSGITLATLQSWAATH
ncbi:hypothetical protein [Agromyces sp. NPDC049794]|uniref:hypothetical protein n=1 Tax=unclassified Agromyces TaxID=2639701 RepID=UPI0033C27F69